MLPSSSRLRSARFSADESAAKASGADQIPETKEKSSAGQDWRVSGQKNFPLVLVDMNHQESIVILYLSDVRKADSMSLCDTRDQCLSYTV